MNKFINKFKKELTYFKSNKEYVLFDHLPKCAGTMINSNLAKAYPERLTFYIDGAEPVKSAEEFKSLSQKNRWSKRLVYGHNAHQLLDFVNPKAVAITVFREPVDRIISHYYYVKRIKDHYLHDRVIKEKISLENYCSSDLSIELTNWYTWYYSKMSPEEIASNPDKALDCAFQNVITNYKIIGFQDKLPQFLKAVETLLNVELEVTERNKTEKRISIDDIEPFVIKKIEEANSLDIKLYGKLLKLRKNGVVSGI